MVSGNLQGAVSSNVVRPFSTMGFILIDVHILLKVSGPRCTEVHSWPCSSAWLHHHVVSRNMSLSLYVASGKQTKRTRRTR